MRPIHHRIKFLFSLLFIIVLFLAFFTLGYGIVQLFEFNAPMIVRYLAAIMISIILIIAVWSLLFLIVHRRKRNYALEIINALKKIANGDYSVQLDIEMRERNEVTDIIDQFNQMAKQLKQMEDMRQEFISNVSHEIQSPLTSIVGFVQALQTNSFTEEERNHYLQIIETESRRLSKLSENLLKLTSLESDHHPFEKHTYRLDHQLRAIILACEPQWLKKDLQIEVSLEPLNITADEDLMNQVWTNLLHNSIKFTPSSGTLSIQSLQLENQIVVIITDTGVGMSDNDVLHIFERFYKADQARVRSKSGSGLGLSIVKKIVDMHEGTIIVESEIGKGTTFTITLPHA